ncbi:GntR family transcriptional regulator [Clostridium acetobutylicum]|nr:GntR family transcriptional regulator [Clostridium acetobutylicum]
MKIVSKSSPLPLHYQLKMILQEMIENEELLPGDTIPTERELCEIQKISRMTVNKAILSLVSEGILYREQGKGTFVSKKKEKQQLTKLKSFTEEMREKGLNISTKILSFEIKTATKHISALLELPPNEMKVIEIIRLRLTDNDPSAIETVVLPLYLFSDMTKEVIDGKSLYNTFREKYDYEPTKAKQTIEPIMLTDYEAKFLNQVGNSLALLFRRLTYRKDGVPIEYTKSIYRSEKYKYEVILT